MSNLTPEELEFENNVLDDSTFAGGEEVVREFIDQVPLLSPVDISNELEKLGYKGQIDQRRALSLMAYRHVRRLKRIYLEGESPNDLPPKQNVLMQKPDTGARGLQTELVAAVERAAFDTFMQMKNARVVIDVKDGHFTSEVS